MLYLEDYLEMIEHLPQELRDRFTEMRELDLTVQNNVDSLEKKTRNFFQQCKRGELLHDSADCEFHHLRREYYKVMEDADEKVAIATQIHELVERYLRRLDSELFKFKCELEADNNGITEILEKRSLELDGHTNTTSTSLMLSINQKENRFYGSPSIISNPAIINTNSTSILNVNSVISGGGSVSGAVGSNITNSGVTNIGTSISNTPQPRQRKLEKRRETICTMTVPEKRPNLNHSLPSNHVTSSSHSVTPVRPLTSSLATHSVLGTSSTGTTVPTSTAVAYNLQIGGAASSAIAAAASQAIVATQQMQQGRRTASLKASYEAIHGGAGVGPTEFWIANAANATVATHNPTSLPPIGPSSIHHHDKKQKKNFKHHHNMTIAANVAISNLTGSSSGTSITSSSSSSLSADSIEVLSTATTASASGGVSTTSDGISTSGGVGVSSIGLSSTSVTGNTLNSGAIPSAVNAMPSTSIAPGANITINENGQVVEQSNESEWPYDPNEPRYCTCNQVSYGDMVACDNEACPYEWFHYPCVGITQPPKGKWYCPKCTASMRRRGNRKN